MHTRLDCTICVHPEPIYLTKCMTRKATSLAATRPLAVRGALVVYPGLFDNHAVSYGISPEGNLTVIEHI